MRANRKQLPSANESSSERWARKAKEQAKETQKLLKKLHPAEVEDRREWASYLARASVDYLPGDFPLELIANIASRLLRGENYTNAATRALKLLRECDHQRKQLKEARESLDAAWRNATDLSSDYDVPEGLYPMPYPVAIKAITQQSRFDRAEQYYLRFLEALYPNDDKRHLSARIKVAEKHGIDAAEVKRLSRRFLEFRATGKLGIRKPPKEKFDTKSETDG